MGAGSKILKGTLMTGAAVAAIGGIAVYNAGKYVRRLLYPPTVKKYVALAAIPFVLYGIRRPIQTVDAVTGAVHAAGSSMHSAVSGAYNNKVLALSSKVDSLVQENQSLTNKVSELEEIDKDREAGVQELYKSSSAQSQKSAAVSSLNSLARIYSTALLVDAESNTVSLLKSNGSNYLVTKIYDCTTGRNPARKQFVGDLATPEGIFMSYVESNPGWNERFTDEFLRLDLPRNLGAGIFVVGTRDSEISGAISKKQDVTNGGVVIQDSSFGDLVSNFYRGQNVPVAIYFGNEKQLPNYVAEMGFLR